MGHWYIALAALHCIVLHCNALNYSALHCREWQCIALHCSVLHCTSLQCRVLHRTSLHCPLLHYIAIYCGMHFELDLNFCHINLQGTFHYTIFVGGWCNVRHTMLLGGLSSQNFFNFFICLFFLLLSTVYFLLSLITPITKIEVTICISWEIQCLWYTQHMTHDSWLTEIAIYGWHFFFFTFDIG